MPASTKRGTPLSREDVVDAAILLMREHGLDGLTMRAVAAELDVTPMATYHHVRNKDELVGLVAQQVMSQTTPLVLGSDGWEAALRDHLLSLWTTLAQYPGLASYMINLPTLGNTAESYREGRGFFEQAGFSRRIAPLAWSFALTFVHGRLSVDSKLDRRAAHDAGLDTVPAPDHVVFGVEAVILGLRAVREDDSLFA